MSSSYSSDFYTLDDITYEITVVDGTWESLYGEYGTLIKNSPWWGDEDLATDLSKEFGKTLGKFGDAAAGISAPYYYTLLCSHTPPLAESMVMEMLVMFMLRLGTTIHTYFMVTMGLTGKVTIQAVGDFLIIMIIDLLTVLK